MELDLPLALRIGLDYVRNERVKIKSTYLGECFSSSISSFMTDASFFSVLRDRVHRGRS